MNLNKKSGAEYMIYYYDYYIIEMLKYYTFNKIVVIFFSVAMVNICMDIAKVGEGLFIYLTTPLHYYIK